MKDCIGCNRKSTVISCLEIAKSYLNMLLVVNDSQITTQKILISQVDKIIEILKEKYTRVIVVNVKLLVLFTELQKSKDIFTQN